MAASADWQPPQIASLVRASLELDEPGLAESILGGFPARNPYAQNAAVAAKAAIHEARGDLAAAIEGYGDAAERWSSFEVVPELAFALLGQGRSRVASGRAAEAAEPLARARSDLRASRGGAGTCRDRRAIRHSGPRIGQAEGRMFWLKRNMLVGS